MSLTSTIRTDAVIAYLTSGSKNPMCKQTVVNNNNKKLS